jgi:hypothetical protein
MFRTVLFRLQVLVGKVGECKVDDTKQLCIFHAHKSLNYKFKLTSPCESNQAQIQTAGLLDYNKCKNAISGWLHAACVQSLACVVEAPCTDQLQGRRLWA